MEYIIASRFNHMGHTSIAHSDKQKSEESLIRPVFSIVLDSQNSNCNGYMNPPDMVINSVRTILLVVSIIHKHVAAN